MIPRYQKIVVLVLLVVSIAMAAVLVRLRERAHDRLLKGEDVAPTTAPAVAPAEPATLLIANDMDGGMVTSQADWSLNFDLGMSFHEWHGPVPGAHELGAVSEALGVRSSGISSIRTNLIRKGIVFSPSAGTIAFRIPLADRYIRSHASFFFNDAAQSYMTGLASRGR